MATRRVAQPPRAQQLTGCPFCQLAAGHEPCHEIWSDDGHLAFLSPFPSTEGFSIVATRQNPPSYAFAVEGKVRFALVLPQGRWGCCSTAASPMCGGRG